MSSEALATCKPSSQVDLADWQTVPLADVADISRGTSWGSENEHREAVEDALPVLGIKNVQARLETRDLIWLRGLKPSAIASSTVQAGDILMVGSNGNPDRIGNAVQVDEPGRYLFASLLFGLRPRREVVDPDFLFQAIVSPRNSITKIFAESIRLVALKSRFCLLVQMRPENDCPFLKEA